MGELRASPTELARTGRGVRASADGLDERVKALAARVESFLDGGWQGDASDAFRRDWELWRDGARQVISGLDAMAVLLESAGRSYSGQDAANSEAIGATGSSLKL